MIRRLVAFATQVSVALALLGTFWTHCHSQERRSKVRISNAGFTLTALPLLAAKDWGMFTANGLDVELIVMNPSLAAARWCRAISITLPVLGPLPSPRP